MSKESLDVADVREILDVVRAEGIRVIVEGGWAVDGLVGRQTRSHSDLDIAVDSSDFDDCVAALHASGFIRVEDELPTRAAFVDAVGRQVDVHPRVLASHWYQGVTTQGAVGDVGFECLIASRQIEQHRNHELRPSDVADLEILEAIAKA